MTDLPSARFAPTVAGLQGQAPTVGDTVWVTRTVALPRGATLRPADWAPSDTIQRLGPPTVAVHGDSATVAYPVVVWHPGRITAEVPGPLLLLDGGRIDSLAPAQIELRVASVLPSQPAESLAPQPRADFVPRTTVSPWPVLVLLLLAALVLAPLHWWWRRRGRPRPRLRLPLAGQGGPPLDHWSDSGETRAVAAVASQRLRGVIATRMPAAHTGLDTEALLQVIAARRDWPLTELTDLLHALDEARFGQVAFPDAVGLARWADELAPRLVAEAA
jgi:hypothetical protein